jgi:hypothetical protein
MMVLELYSGIGGMHFAFKGQIYDIASNISTKCTYIVTIYTVFVYSNQPSSSKQYMQFRCTLVKTILQYQVQDSRPPEQ